MIPTTYENAIFIYLLLWIVYLSILWIRELWRTNINAWSLTEGRLCICGDCRHAFLAKPGEFTAKCPKCGNVCYLSRNKYRRNY